MQATHPRGNSSSGSRDRCGGAGGDGSVGIPIMNLEDATHAEDLSGRCGDWEECALCSAFSEVIPFSSSAVPLELFFFNQCVIKSYSQALSVQVSCFS